MIRDGIGYIPKNPNFCKPNLTQTQLLLSEPIDKILQNRGKNPKPIARNDWHLSPWSLERFLMKDVVCVFTFSHNGLFCWKNVQQSKFIRNSNIIMYKNTYFLKWNNFFAELKINREGNINKHISIFRFCLVIILINIYLRKYIDTTN